VLEGVARHASTHAAGVLITPGPLLDHVPLYRQRDESVTTQWDMKSVEKVGLLKMDFLGLRTLSVLEESVRLIAEKTGERLELTKLPMDDADTYALFQRADTVAIFQFESTGMRDYLRKLKPTVFEDLVAMNALYRPGPMENIPYFIDCKHGRQVVRYEHQALEPILKKTYGVFIYQEQVMEAAHRLAGFSLALPDTRLITIAGLVTGISAAFSMAASDYLSSKAEGDERAGKSALYTGTTYLLTVILLILPFLLVGNKFASLAITLAIVVSIIALFNYYISVAKELDFRRRFLEMSLISLGVAAFSFFVGYVLKAVLGVDA